MSLKKFNKILIKEETGKSYTIGEVYEIFFNDLILFGFKYTNSNEIIEDSIQEIFLKAMKTDLVFYEKSKLKGYLYKSLRNYILDIKKKQKVVEKHAQNMSYYDDSQDSFEEAIIESETLSEILSAYNQLPAKCREVFGLKLYGLSTKEISEDLNISVETVKTHKRLAKKQLKELLTIVKSFLLLFTLFLVLVVIY